MYNDDIPAFSRCHLMIKLRRNESSLIYKSIDTMEQMKRGNVMVLVVGVLVEQGNNGNGIHDVESLNFG